MNLYGDLLRGHTDAIILSILRKSDSYGYEINQTIRERSNHLFELTEATLYTAFKRLEQQGLISSYWMEGNNHVKRKYYSITTMGKIQLEEKIQAFIETTQILEVFLKK
jgi:DNA-binding PadR family transcriptional regulator